VEKAEFEAEAARLVAAATERGVTIRLLGALAFAYRCPGHTYLQDALGRVYTDIDFAGYGKQARELQRFFAEQGFAEDAGIYVESQGTRLIFEQRATGLHVDVFLDRLEFCHTVEWRDRLAVDPVTIPLAELLLQKMQIVQINEKDLIDTIMLLLEHPVTEDDDTGVDAAFVARICAKDWGWWRTLTMNLGKVRQMAASYPQLSDADQARVSEQVRAIEERIEAEPKGRGWRLRARVGDRKKWYRDVDELAPTEAI
jgi:hypothetical protein